MNRFSILFVAFSLPLFFCVAQAEEKKSAPSAEPASPGQSGAEGSGSGISEALLDVVETYRSTGDLDAILKIRFLRVLVVYSKTFYFLDGVEERGAVYEYAKQFESFLNRKLQAGRIPVHLAFIAVRSDQLLPFLVEGRGDIAATDLTITPERQRIVNFSVPIDAGKGFSQVVVTGPGAPVLSSIEDLGGKEVFVRKSSSYYAAICDWNKKRRRRGKPRIKVKAADENLEDEDILELVNAGIVPITVVDSHLAEFWEGIYGHILVRKDLAIMTGDHVGWAVRKDNPKLEALLNDFIRSHPVLSVSTNPILRRYLVENVWARNPASLRGRKRFQNVVEVFKKYGAKYDLDYLLLAALAYHESGLNQNRRSPRGAVGIMQIMPATAASHPVKIPNVQILDNNVHAAAKYLRFLIDSCYSEPDVTPMNQALFALASYNAGPARISSMRRKAAAEGLDPNQWFDNVERIVAREIGRETVRYVRNVFKCFVAYNLLHDREMDRNRAISKEKSGHEK